MCSIMRDSSIICSVVTILSSVETLLCAVITLLCAVVTLFAVVNFLFAVNGYYFQRSSHLCTGQIKAGNCVLVAGSEKMVEFIIGIAISDGI